MPNGYITPTILAVGIRWSAERDGSLPPPKIGCGPLRLHEIADTPIKSCGLYMIEGHVLVRRCMGIVEPPDQVFSIGEY